MKTQRAVRLLFVAALTLSLAGLADAKKKKDEGEGEAGKEDAKKKEVIKMDFDLQAECTPAFYVDAYREIVSMGIGQGDPDAFLLRAKMLKCNMHNSKRAMDTGRKWLFELAATEEQKAEVLAMKERANTAAEGEEKDKLTVELQDKQDEAINSALEGGAYAQKELDDNQKKNASKLGYNLALAQVYLALSVKDGALMVVEGKNIVDEIRGNKLKAIKLATRVKEIASFMKSDLPYIAKSGPEYGKKVGSFANAVQALKQTNEIEDLGAPKAGDTFQEVDF